MALGEYTSVTTANEQIDSEVGVERRALRNYPQAEKAYKAVLEILPDNINVLNNLAYMYAESLDRPADARPYGERVAKLAPNNPDVLDTHGWALAKSGQFAEAEQVLLRAVQTGRASAEIRYHLGWVNEKTGRPSDALRQYRRALETAPEKGPVRDMLEDAVKRLSSAD